MAKPFTEALAGLHDALGKSHAEFDAGYRCGLDDLETAVARARQQGFDAGYHVNPSWLDLCVISCLFFMIGFLAAVAFFA